MALRGSVNALPRQGQHPGQSDKNSHDDEQFGKRLSGTSTRHGSTIPRQTGEEITPPRKRVGGGRDAGNCCTMRHSRDPDAEPVRDRAAPAQLRREARGMEDAAGEMDGMYAVGIDPHGSPAGRGKGGARKKRAPFLRTRRGDDRHGHERSRRTARAVRPLARPLRRPRRRCGLMIDREHPAVLIQTRGDVVAATRVGDARRAAQHGQNGQSPSDQPEQSRWGCGNHPSRVVMRSADGALCPGATSHQRSRTICAGTQRN